MTGKEKQDVKWLTTNNVIPIVGLIITLVTLLVNFSNKFENLNGKLDLANQNIGQIIETQKSLTLDNREISNRVRNVEVDSASHATQINNLLAQFQLKVQGVK